MLVLAISFLGPHRMRDEWRYFVLIAGAIFVIHADRGLAARLAHTAADRLSLPLYAALRRSLTSRFANLCRSMLSTDLGTAPRCPSGDEMAGEILGATI